MDNVAKLLVCAGLATLVVSVAQLAACDVPTTLEAPTHGVATVCTTGPNVETVTYVDAAGVLHVDSMFDVQCESSTGT